MARALASHASKAGKKVSFFMRKGADILSKWVGEAERQLRLLFEEAQKAQPAIIFFDEIDGIAPVLPKPAIPLALCTFLTLWNIMTCCAIIATIKFDSCLGVEPLRLMLTVLLKSSPLHQPD